MHRRNVNTAAPATETTAVAAAVAATETMAVVVAAPATETTAIVAATETTAVVTTETMQGTKQRAISRTPVEITKHTITARDPVPAAGGWPTMEFTAGG